MSLRATKSEKAISGDVMIKFTKIDLSVSERTQNLKRRLELQQTDQTKLCLL